MAPRTSRRNNTLSPAVFVVCFCAMHTPRSSRTVSSSASRALQVAPDRCPRIIQSPGGAQASLQHRRSIPKSAPNPPASCSDGLFGMHRFSAMVVEIRENAAEDATLEHGRSA